MSALTDLFTAMANKIRSKTGTATTYTPLQMVSDGIDDVYAAGYDAGGGGATGIPITPSNAAPVTLTNGESYSMLANGYAVSSYTSINPSDSSPVPLSAQTIYRVTNGSNGGYAIASYSSVTPSNSSPVSLSSGSIYKMGGNGKAVASVTDATPSNSSPVSLSSGTVYKMGGAGKAVASVTDITPSDSSPASMSSGSIYKAGSAGYAIASNPTSVTPSSSGVYFDSGIKKMTASGYAYSARPTPTETTLWTNSSPTSTFAAQTVNLSQSYSNFDYLKFVFRRSTSDSYEAVFVFPKSEFTSKSRSLTVGISGTTAGSDNVLRNIYQSSGSTSQMKFSTGWSYGNTNVPGNCIPKSIVGIKNS